MRRAVLRSLVPVICPPEAHGLADAIVDHVDQTLAASPPLLGKAFAAGLVAYDVGAIARYGRRASKLTGERAERYFALWEKSPGRTFVHAVNQLVSLACYEQPELTERLGYQPAPWIEQMRHKRLTVYRDDVRRQDAQVLAPDPLRPGVSIGKRKRGA